MNFAPGMKVEKRVHRAGGGDQLVGTSTVLRVNKTTVILYDGTKWRIDGYVWGCKPTRGCGRYFEPRIVPAPTDQKEGAP